MNENDRSSMHEAMEQQRISVSKAGINATLSTRCAILAAANPKAGRFTAVSETPFTQQINLKPALISRFDVIWLLTDQPVADHDSMIANHIMTNRAESTPEILIEQGTEVDPSKLARHEGFDNEEGIVNRELIRKYVAFAKRTIHPRLTDEAREALRDFYVETRRKTGESTDSISISARAIEGLYRLAQASARVRLSDVASIDDAERSIRLTRFWRHELMGENFDETTIHSGKKPTKRNRERAIVEIVRRITLESGQAANLNDVLTEVGRLDISKDVAMDIIDDLVTAGQLMRPQGYETLAPV
jgi:replicative DNA helicase Mcm